MSESTNNGFLTIEPLGLYGQQSNFDGGSHLETPTVLPEIIYSEIYGKHTILED